MSVSSWRRADDTGALPLAMLLTIVGVLLSAVMASIMAVQLTSTRRALQAARALDAAQAGLDIAVGHIRVANDGTAINGTELRGEMKLLPCNQLDGGTRAFTGQVGVGGKSTYAVAIEYQDKFRLPITCQPGGGTLKAPVYAKLVSLGTDLNSDVRRTLEASYVFRSYNENIAGGQIQVYHNPGDKELCFDAGSGSPTAETDVTMQPCVPDSDQQTFAYTRDLTLLLVSSINPNTQDGMCLDAGELDHVNDRRVKFRPCLVPKQPRQQWSFNDMANFEGTKDGVTLDGFCFHVEFPDVEGSGVILKKVGGSCYAGYNNRSTFSPDALVGAGAAGPATGQLVNFGQFGRCLDVTEQNKNYQYMIIWPCKQTPDPTLLSWNQRWETPPPTTAEWVIGPIKTRPPASNPYCLESPGTITPQSYVKIVECQTPLTDATKWKVWRNAVSYADRFQIQDFNGNCLTATDTDPATLPVLYPKGRRIAPAVILACNGNLRQKWNADPWALDPSPLDRVLER